MSDLLRKTFKEVYTDMEELINITSNKIVLNESEIKDIKYRMLENLKAIELHLVDGLKDRF